MSLPASRRRGDATGEVADGNDARSRDVAAAGFFLLLALWLTWPLAGRMTTGLSGAPDALLNAWALGWSFHVLPETPLALFDANIFAPRPDTLAYSEHLFGIAVVVWPVFLLTGNLVLAYNVAFLSAFVLSGIGGYLLARDLTGDRRAGLVAGAILLAAPYRFGHLLQLQLQAYQWLPFVFWCLVRFLRDGRPRQLAGVVLFSILQLLSCNYYAVYLTYAVLLFGLVLLVTGRTLLTRGKILSLAGGALVVLAVVAPFVAPYLRNQERGFYRRYEDVAHFSARPSDYFRPTSFHRTPLVGVLPLGRPSERSLYLGLTTMALAVAGSVLGYRATTGDDLRRTVWWFFVLLTIAAVVLSLGPERGPYGLLYRHAPGFGGMRAPARLGLFALFGASMLAAWGVARLGRRRTLVSAGVLAALLFEVRTYSLARVFPDAPAIPEAHRWLAHAPAAGAVLVLPIHEGEEIVRESLYMWYATAHFRPLVNGFSGWWPNDYWRLVGRLRHFPTARSLRLLVETAPVRYVVVHYDRIPEPRRRQLRSGMERYRERMPIAFRAGSDVVYEILDPS